MRPYRLALAAAAFCAGVFCVLHGEIALAAAGAAIALGVSRVGGSDRGRAMLGGVVAIALVAGSIAGVLRPDAQPIAETRTRVFDAVVLSCADTDMTNTHQLVLRIGGLAVEALVSGRPISVGARVRIRGHLEPPDVARNPGEPSPRDLAKERGIDGTLARARPIAIGDVDEADASLWLPRLRAWASVRIRSALDEPYASIATGVLLGERAALPHDLRDEFQETGTTHVLVTAGLHLGVVATLAVIGLQLLGLGRVSSSLAAIAIVWPFAALTGWHLPALRAATMTTVALVARASGRRALSWNALALAACVVVALRPSSIDGVSFAMSFSCVAAIVLLAGPLAEALAPLRLPHLVAEAVALTLATQIGTWPLTASTFLTIAPYAPLANAVVVPIVGLVMVVGLGLIACADVPLLAHAIANAETSLIAWIVETVSIVSRLPGAVVRASPPPTWAIVVYDLAIVLAAALLRSGRRVAAAGIFAAACATCRVPPWDAHTLRIVVLDVGQADAIVIRTPAGHVFLVDAGGRLERGGSPQNSGDSSAEAVGERIVVPYLLRAGIRHVDALLMSHPHGDHVCGAPPVLRDLDVAVLADSGQAYPGHCYSEAMELARRRAVPVFEPRGGTVWQTDDGVVFRFYAPTLPYITGSRSDINSNSLVFRLEYGSFRMLFTGDAGAETEARLLAAHDDLHADVLKVGHHGSSYGTTAAFVDAIEPRCAVISVGRHNLFGHPAPSTIATLRDHGSAVFRTDEDAAVMVESNGDAYRVRPFAGARRSCCGPHGREDRCR